MAIKMYFPAKSVVHRVDARVKIILMFCYLILVFLFSNPLYLAPLAAFSLGLFYASKIPASAFKLLFKTMLVLGISC